MPDPTRAVIVLALLAAAACDRPDLDHDAAPSEARDMAPKPAPAPAPAPTVTPEPAPRPEPAPAPDEAETPEKPPLVERLASVAQWRSDLLLTADARPLALDEAKGEIYVAAHVEGDTTQNPSKKPLWFGVLDRRGQLTRTLEFELPRAAQLEMNVLPRGERVLLGGATGTSAWVGLYRTSGERLWLRKLKEMKTITAVDYSADGLLIAVGEDDERSVRVARYNQDGERLWARALEKHVALRPGGGVVPFNDGGAFIGATAIGEDHTSLYAARLDSSGELLWSKTLGEADADQAAIQVMGDRQGFKILGTDGDAYAITIVSFGGRVYKTTRFGAYIEPASATLLPYGDRLMVCTDEGREAAAPSRFLFTRELEPLGQRALDGDQERDLFRCEHAYFAYGNYEFISIRKNTPELGGLVIRRFETPL